MGAAKKVQKSKAAKTSTVRKSAAAAAPKGRSKQAKGAKGAKGAKQSDPSRKPSKALVTKAPRTATRQGRSAGGAPRETLSIVRSVEALTFLRSLIRDVPDFPKPGIVFKDIMPLLANPRGFHMVLDALAERFIGDRIDAVVGIEARGFIFGAALAARLNASFVPARKPGKLPGAADRISLKTEYSSTELEMQTDALVEGSSVIVVDDVLATGGTASAAADLVRRQGAYVVGFAFAIELLFLNGRDKLLPVRVESVVAY
jgi:adenine phosphoribosyltransferase